MSAKEIIVAPIGRADADSFVRAVHYSGRVVRNSQLHLGVFLAGKLEGVMQFGPPIDKKRMRPLVSGTAWNGFLELNRLAFGERLPRNSESRAIAVAMRLIRKSNPHVEWIVSFADATQCGDGAIYRASGFVLTQINRNKTLWEIPGVGIVSDLSTRTSNKATQVLSKVTLTKKIVSAQALTARGGRAQARDLEPPGSYNGASSMRRFQEIGGRPLPGFQLRYVFFLNPAARARLTCNILPFSEIDKAGARMYLGRAGEARDGRDQRHSDGEAPIRPLHPFERETSGTETGQGGEGRSQNAVCEGIEKR